MELFEEKVLKTIKKYNMISGGDKVVVGLSGGADSCALLLALCSLKDELGISVSAAHLNHGIRGAEAKRDLYFSKSLAKELSIPFYEKSVSVPEYAKNKHISEETSGRELRYFFFNEICKENALNKIAVAHNKNDKVETVVMNFLRGSGTNGLVGIKPVNKNIIRPLINISRDEIERYVNLKHINYVTDSTNLENIYTRNFIRNSILPKFYKINSGFLENISNCSEIIESENDFIDSYAKSLDAIKKIGEDVFIDKKIFSFQHIAVKRRLIINAINTLKGNTSNISAKNIDLIINSGRTGSIAELPEGIFSIIQYDSIKFTLNELETASYEYNVKIPGKIIIKEIDTEIEFTFIDKKINTKVDEMMIDFSSADTNKVFVRSRKDGDIFYPSGMNGSKKIKKFFIDNKISLHERNFYPLLQINDEIAAVIPLRASRNFIIDSNTKKILKIKITGGKNG